MRQHPSKVWLRLPPRRSAICKLRLHCARWQRRFSGSLCSQREQFCPAQSSTRAPLKEAIRLFRRKPNIAESRRRAKKELSKGSSKPIRARLLEKEIIQTRDARLNKISASARTKNGARTSVARPPKKGFHSFCVSKIEMKSQRAANAAERQRSRSEADTGRSFELVLATLKGRAGRSLRPRRPATHDARFGPRRLRPDKTKSE